MRLVAFASVVNVELPDLYLAYRQAKAAVYAELRGAGLLEFARYEARLGPNLSALRARLANDSWFDRSPLGTVWLTPKKADGDGAVRDVLRIGVPRPTPLRRPTLEVRVALSPTIDFLVTEVLYVWAFGPSLDGQLATEALGNRLKLRGGAVDRAQHHLFKYWPEQYQRFCESPAAAAQAALITEPNGCFVASLDLASFYDSIDPSFLVADAFVRQVAAVAAQRQLPFDGGAYLIATRSLLRALARYHGAVTDLLGGRMQRGIPIGTITSRLISNLALQPLDRAIVAHQSVLYYARYVDDIAIVARRDHETDPNATAVTVLSRWMPVRQASPQFIWLDEGTLLRPGSDLRVSRSKTTIHELAGAEGREFVRGVIFDMRRVASERRMFVEPGALRGEALASLARLEGNETSKVRVLRDADRRRLANLELSVAVHALQRIATLLNRDEARRITNASLTPVLALVPNTPDWVERIELIQKLLRVAFLADDTDSARELLRLMRTLWGSIDALRSRFPVIVWNSYRTTRRGAFARVVEYLRRRVQEAVFASVRLEANLDAATALQDEVGLTVGQIVDGAVSFGAADLRTLDREDDLIDPDRRRETAHDELRADLVLNQDLADRFEQIARFQRRCRTMGDASWETSDVALFASTRPPSYFDVARRWLSEAESRGFDVDVFDILLQIVNSVRGTAYRDPVGGVLAERVVHIELEEDALQPACRLILGNLHTQTDWYLSALERTAEHPRGNPVHSYRRLCSISDVLHKADSAARRRVRGARPPSLLLLPELSVPRRWVRAISKQVLKNQTFSLVAGLEYHHDATRAVVHNQALAILVGKHKSVATWLWTKGYPSDEEGRQLRSSGLSFPAVIGSLSRTVISSRFGCMSVLICSELIEPRLLSQLVASLELVLVPSWNRDTAAYDHLIQSAGLQMHCVVAIANNAKYSDCRAWAPYETRWRRDLCRLIQRYETEVIWVDLPLEELRRVHYEGGDPAWRPMPPGTRR